MLNGALPGEQHGHGLKSVFFLKKILGKIAQFAKTAPLISFISTGQFLQISGWCRARQPCVWRVNLNAFGFLD